MNKEKPRLGFISVHRAPYRDPVLERIHSRENIDVEAIILFREDTGHPYWQLDAPVYPHIFLESKNRIIRRVHFAPGVFRVLAKRDYDVVAIPGYYHPTCNLALCYCISTRTPFIWLSDACLFKQRPLFTRMLKWPFMKALVNLMGAAWVPGIAGREFLTSYGAKQGKVFEGLYTLDTTSILKSLENARAIRRHTRDSLYLENDQIALLMVANMIPKRGLGVLLEALLRLLDHRKDLKLVLIGEGPEKHNIEVMIRDRPELIKHICLLGSVPFEDLTGYYLSADAYVHSSVNEEYSVSVAYAAICGLPIIATDRVGAAYDYVIEGVTGALAKAGDSRSLADAIERVISDRDHASIIGKSAQHRAERFSVEWAANQLENAAMVSVYDSWHPFRT